MSQSKLRVLFLHGFGESQLIASMAAHGLQEAVESAGHEFLPIPDGFLQLSGAAAVEPIVDAEYKKMVQSGELTAYAWYPLVKGLTGGHRDPSCKDFDFRATPESQANAVAHTLKALRWSPTDALGGTVWGHEGGIR